MNDYRRSYATYREQHPHATERQWQVARASANLRRRQQGLPEIARADSPVVHFHDKKVGVTDWKEVTQWIIAGQEIKKKGSWSQHHADIEINTTSESILLIPFGDAHIGSWGTSYADLVALTNEVRDDPRLYLGAVGDLVNLAIKLRGVLEVKDDILPPAMQHDFFESWLDAISPKLLFAGWGNHDVEREELGVGASIHKRLLERKVPYFAGIGHVNLRVGDSVYRMAVSHRFRGSTNLTPLGGQKRYMRFEGQDREIALGGDLHRPCYESYFDGPTARIALNCGSIQTGSGYAQRYFSLFTIAEYPCIELFANEHRMIPYASLADWQATVNRKAQTQ